MAYQETYSNILSFTYAEISIKSTLNVQMLNHSSTHTKKLKSSTAYHHTSAPYLLKKLAMKTQSMNNGE